jgi:hypothetical protein
MHGPLNVKSANNISKWQMGFISAFKGLISRNFAVGLVKGRKNILVKITFLTNNSYLLPPE